MDVNSYTWALAFKEAMLPHRIITKETATLSTLPFASVESTWQNGLAHQEEKRDVNFGLLARPPPRQNANGLSCALAMSALTNVS